MSPIFYALSRWRSGLAPSFILCHLDSVNTYCQHTMKLIWCHQYVMHCNGDGEGFYHHPLPVTLIVSIHTVSTQRKLFDDTNKYSIHYNSDEWTCIITHSVTLIVSIHTVSTQRKLFDDTNKYSVHYNGDEWTFISTKWNLFDITKCTMHYNGDGVGLYHPSLPVTLIV